MHRASKKFRSVVALLALVGGSMALVGAIAATSGATADGGYIEICKVFATPPISVTTDAPFTFTITGDTNAWTTTVTVDAGTAAAPSCDDPVPVDLGQSYTIAETPGVWYGVTDIETSTYPGQSFLLSDSLSAGTADVSVSAGTVSSVTFTNSLVTGYAKVCKTSPAGSPLSGNYSFNLAGEDGYASTVTVPLIAGTVSCSGAIQVPAGVLTTTEAGTNLYVTGITAYENSNTNDGILTGGPDLVTGTASFTVEPNTDMTQISVVTYTDDVVGLKICKEWDGDLADQPQGTATTYSFTETVNNGVAGPDTAPGTFNLTANPGENCSSPVAYRPGTSVTITEGVTPGTEAYSIDNYGAQSLDPSVTPNPDLANRSITVLIGTPTTSSGSPGNEAVIEFHDGLAYPSTLELCKDAGTDTGTFNFTIAGPQYVGDTLAIAPGSFTASITVPAGVTNGTVCQDFTNLPYNGTQLITETGQANFQATAISSNLTDVSVWEGSTFTATTEPVLSNVTLGGVDTNSSADVTMSEGPSTTQITWTNADPPPPAAPSHPATVANPGSTNAGTTTAPTYPQAVSIAAHVAQKVNAFKYVSRLLKVETSMRSIERALRSHHLSAALRRADLKRLAHLRAERVHLFTLIRRA
ncbi:MAG: hypothetical protein WCF24_00160 [Acidimicrobiales bacterium]